MLTQEQNEQLTRTDRGTLMGDLFRRYWIPAVTGIHSRNRGSNAQNKAWGFFCGRGCA